MSTASSTESVQNPVKKIEFFSGSKSLGCFDTSARTGRRITDNPDGTVAVTFTDVNISYRYILKRSVRDPYETIRFHPEDIISVEQTYTNSNNITQTVKYIGNNRWLIPHTDVYGVHSTGELPDTPPTTLFGYGNGTAIQYKGKEIAIKWTNMTYTIGCYKYTCSFKETLLE